MKVEILTAAEIEFIEAVSYLNERLEGLGDEFAIEIKRTITRIISFPTHGPSYPPELTAAGLSVFLMPLFIKFVER